MDIPIMELEGGRGMVGWKRYLDFGEVQPPCLTTKPVPRWYQEAVFWSGGGWAGGKGR